MAVPKRKICKARRDKRRANKKLTTASFSTCPQCNELRLPHRICPSCGYYHDRSVLEMEEV